MVQRTLTIVADLIAFPPADWLSGYGVHIPVHTRENYTLIDFHMTPSPNSKKIKIALEELGADHETKKYSIQDGEHLTPEFRAISPNLKLPTIVDDKPDDGGEPISVFESGAILIYLAEKHDRFLPKELRPRMAALQWLTWQVAGLGPMMGQAGHFLRYAPKNIDHSYSFERYLNESRRLVRVLDNRLKRCEFLAGDEYSVADMATWPMVTDGSPFLQIDLAGEYPNVRRWADTIRARPSIQRMIDSPEFAPGPEYELKRELTEEQFSNNFGENLMKAVVED